MTEHEIDHIWLEEDVEGERRRCREEAERGK
jgi:hypothetical protein